MNALFLFLARRLRPRVGWPTALLAFAAAACPALAAASASLRLPDGLILWAGLAGAAIGLRVGGLRGRGWRGLYAVAALTLAAFLLLAALESLPPPGLLWADAGALAGAARGWLNGARPGMPELLTSRFLELSLPRAWRALAGAPGAGEAGAALIVATTSLATTLAGAIAIGYGCAAWRRPLAWGLPLVGALALTTVLGGGEGTGLIVGLGAVLGLALMVGYTARERGWEASGVAYSDELRLGVLGWGSLLTGGALMLALALPTSLPRLPTFLGGPGGDLPSGLAAIESRVQRGGRPAVDPGLSQLPAVNLGMSLSAAPPDTVALRVRLAAPLPPSPYPRYWRARVLNVYTGRAWWADARVGALTPAAPELEAPDAAVVQEIELVERDSPVLVALPDVLALDVPTRAERLADGSLAAMTGEPAGHYRVVSRPQELAPAQPLTPEGAPSGPPPGQDSLGLPPGVPPRVRELARSVAEGAGGPLEQALAIEAYLRGLPYAYEVQPIPAGGDAVDQFLFTMRQGYCTYYASAMAVMARSLGIPARVAVGYATGTYDEALGAYVVREADAHAWPELLIGGRWVPFEPTPVRPLPARDTRPPAPTPSPAPLPEAPRTEPWTLPRLVLLWISAIGGGAVALAGGWLAWRRRQLTPLARAQLRLERVGARAGVAWPAGATVHEYGELLAARGVTGDAALGELVALIEAARYAGRPLTAEQMRRLREAARALGSRGRRQTGTD